MIGVALTIGGLGLMLGCLARIEARKAAIARALQAEADERMREGARMFVEGGSR